MDNEVVRSNIKKKDYSLLLICTVQTIIYTLSVTSYSHILRSTIPSGDCEPAIYITCYKEKYQWGLKLVLYLQTGHSKILAGFKFCFTLGPARLAKIARCQLLAEINQAVQAPTAKLNLHQYFHLYATLNQWCKTKNYFQLYMYLYYITCILYICTNSRTYAQIPQTQTYILL